MLLIAVCITITGWLSGTSELSSKLLPPAFPVGSETQGASLLTPFYMGSTECGGAVLNPLLSLMGQ